jgi:uncharacterized membrane protein
MLQLFGPLAFLPLLSLPALIPAMPTLLYNFLSQWPAQNAIYHHYMAPAIPFIVIAGVLGLHGLTKFWGRLSRQISLGRLSDSAIGLGVSLILVATLASWTYANPMRRNISSFRSALEHGSQVPMILPNHAAVREGLKHVPGGVYLLTTSHYVPHLSHRPQIEMYPSGRMSKLKSEVKVIFLNLKDLRWWSCDDYLRSLAAARRSGFGITFSRECVLVLQRDSGDPIKLQGLLDNWPACT